MCVNWKVQAVCSSALQVLGKAELFSTVRASMGLKVPYGGIAVYGARLKSPADPRFCALPGSEMPQWLNAGLIWGYQPGLEALGRVWPADGLCHWAVERGAENAQCPRSGLTTKCVQSLHIGLVSCLSHLMHN